MKHLLHCLEGKVLDVVQEHMISNADLCLALSAWTREGSLSMPTLSQFLRVCLRDV